MSKTPDSDSTSVLRRARRARNGADSVGGHTTLSERTTSARRSSRRSTTVGVESPAAGALQSRDWSLQRNIAFHMASVIFRMDQNLRDTVLRELDLTYAHFRVLQVLYDVDGQQIGDIARAIVVRQPVLSRVITQMQERELVERRADADDSRIMRVYLTDHGRARYEQAWPPAHAIMESAFSVLEPAERTQLEEFMRRVDHHINH